MTKIYFAGAEAFSDICVEHGVNILVSYFNIGKKEIPKLEVFLDSGAYSAFTQKVEINIMNYINYIKNHLDEIETYASLDVIGDAQATYDNFITMKEAGLNPIPTFHVGEDFSYLDKYKEEPYIALGGMVPYSNQPRLLQRWLIKCFKLLKDKKVHGFGMTNADLIARFPFYSVDSTSWLAGNRYKTFYIYSRGKMRTVPMDKKLKDWDYKKLMKWNLIQWKKFADYLGEKHGVQKVTN